MLDVASLEKFDFLNNFVLAAGHNGLSRTISNVVILDHEGIDGDFSDFHEGDFVITNLLFAKNSPPKIYFSFEALISIGVSAFAVKTVFFKELPSEVIELADKKEVPIFLFNDIYIEDVILGITDHLRSSSNYNYYETLLDSFLAPPSHDKQLNEFLAALMNDSAVSLNGKSVSCVYLISPQDIDEFSLQRNINKLTLQSRHMISNASLHILKYKKGILILTFDFPDNIYEFWMKIIKELHLSSYTIGISDKPLNIYKTDIAVERSINSAKHALNNHIAVFKYSDLGLENLIYSIYKDNYFCEFIGEKTQLLSSPKNQSLLKTMHQLVLNGFDIDKTAGALFQHPNTIRYRIGKLKSVMNVETDLEFQILAVLFHNATATTSLDIIS